MRYLKKKKLFILSVFLCVFWTVFPVHGKTLVDVNQEASITIQYQVPNAEFSLYKVADVTDTYQFVVKEQFISYGIDFDTLNTEQWKNVAETLSGYVTRDELEAFATGVTDEQGKLIFDELETGVYLVIGEQIQEEDSIYRCKPFLAFLPIETSEGRWDYHPVLLPKYSKEDMEFIDLGVIKIWQDEGLEAQRPKEIIVQLLKEEEVFEEAILDESNNWKYIWENQPSEYAWHVVEKEVPEGYTVEIIQEGNIFQIVNSKEEQPDIPEKLPQTGQIWWPIPVLTAVGLFFIIVGLVRKRIEDN